MLRIVSITRQGRLSIPQDFLRSFGITGPTKAVVTRKGDVIEVRPQSDFWALESSLRSHVKLSPDELKKARGAFEKQWPKK